MLVPHQWSLRLVPLAVVIGIAAAAVFGSTGVFAGTVSATSSGNSISVTGTCSGPGDILTASGGTAYGSFSASAGNLTSTGTGYTMQCQSANAFSATFACSMLMGTVPITFTLTSGGSASASCVGTGLGTSNQFCLLYQSDPLLYAAYAPYCGSAGYGATNSYCQLYQSNPALYAAYASYCYGAGYGATNSYCQLYQSNPALYTSYASYCYGTGYGASNPYCQLLQSNPSLYASYASYCNMTGVVGATSASIPSAITISTSAASVSCNGSVTMSVFVRDVYGLSVPDGTLVALSTTSGTLSPSTATTSSGVVTVTFTAPGAGTGSATISAQASSARTSATIGYNCPPAAPVVAAPIASEIRPPNTGDGGLLDSRATRSNMTLQSYAVLALLASTAVGCLALVRRSSGYSADNGQALVACEASNRSSRGQE